MKINDRVKELRTALKLTQTEFGKRVDIGQSYLASIESADRNVTEKITRLISLEFNVNEEWLRTGKGQMFIEKDSTIITKLSEEYNLDRVDTEIIKGYLNLDPEQKKAIKAYVSSIASAIAHEEVSAAKIEEDGLSDEDKEVEAYRMEIRAEKKGITSSVSESGEEIG